MKLIKTLLTILFISLLSSPSWSVSLYNLVEREDLFYQKFSDVPFTGETTGDIQGSIKNGMFEGTWVYYHDNGQLQAKGNYKNSKREGAWSNYWDNGRLISEGNYKNGKKEGDWVGYDQNGTVWEPYTGTFKDGVKISD